MDNKGLMHLEVSGADYCERKRIETTGREREIGLRGSSMLLFEAHRDKNRRRTRSNIFRLILESDHLVVFISSWTHRRPLTLQSRRLARGPK